MGPRRAALRRRGAQERPGPADEPGRAAFQPRAGRALLPQRPGAQRSGGRRRRLSAGLVGLGAAASRPGVAGGAEALRRVPPAAAAWPCAAGPSASRWCGSAARSGRTAASSWRAGWIKAWRGELSSPVAELGWSLQLGARRDAGVGGRIGRKGIRRGRAGRPRRTQSEAKSAAVARATASIATTGGPLGRNERSCRIRSHPL